jgi:DNA-binding transcriptional ArsR family regulator
MKSVRAIDVQAEVAMHPQRYKILKCLRDSSLPQYVEQISHATGIHPRLVSFHLDVLGRHGLVECKYTLLPLSGQQRPVGVRLCKTNNKARKLFQSIAKELSTW